MLHQLDPKCVIMWQVNSNTWCGSWWEFIPSRCQVKQAALAVGMPSNFKHGDRPRCSHCGLNPKNYRKTGNCMELSRCWSMGISVFAGSHELSPPGLSPPFWSHHLPSKTAPPGTVGQQDTSANTRSFSFSCKDTVDKVLGVGETDALCVPDMRHLSTLLFHHPKKRIRLSEVEQN